MGFEVNLPECTVIPRSLWWPKFEERKTLSDFLAYMEGRSFSEVPLEEVNKGRLSYLISHDETRIELLLRNMVYSSDASYDDDAPPLCQAVVRVELGVIQNAIRRTKEKSVVGVVVEPHHVELFTMDWEEIDAGRYGNFNELYIPKWDTNRISLTMTHKDNPQAHLKFDNV